MKQDYRGAVIILLSGLVVGRFSTDLAPHRAKVGLLRLHPRAELADRLLQRRSIGEERRDVLEPDARRREISDFTNLRA